MSANECPGCGGELPKGSSLCVDCGARLRRSEPPVDPFIGQVILGKYVLEALIAEGGMGRVYRGRHRELQRTVAVKIIQPGLSSVAQVRARFFLEARALSSLNDPHNISIVDFGEHPSGGLCIVMQFVSGESLGDIISCEAPLPARRAVNLVRQVLGALAEAHALGTLHRDLKPENIIVQKLQDGSDFAVVLDYGIARIVEDRRGRTTAAGAVVGTPLYMSPEQALGRSMGPASDLFSIGVVLYEMLTRTCPCDAEDVTGIFEFHARGEVPPVDSRAGYTGDAALAAILARMLKRAPSDRYATALAAMQALDEWLSGAVGHDACDGCGATFELHARFCAQCGAPRAVVSDEPDASGGVLDGAAPDRSGRRPGQLPLIGRERELAVLAKLTTRPGRLRIAIIGPAGCGRRRLLDELAIMLAQAEARPVVVEPDPPGRARLGGVLRRLVSGMLGVDDDCTLSTFRAAGLRLGLPGPDVAGLVFLCGLSAPPSEMHPEEAEESLRSLMRIAAEQRTAILCRDYDRLDALTRRAFETMLAAAPDEVPFAITARVALPGEWAVVELAPLAPGHASELTSLTLRGLPGVSGPVDVAAHARVVSLGHGVPLALLEAAALERDGGAPLASSSLADIVAGRVARLDGEALALLQRAAVKGGADVGAPGLGTLTARGFMVECNDHFRFAHPLVQEVVYGTLPAEIRRRLHVEAAATAAADREQGAWVAAAHLACTGDARRAMDGWTAAAVQAKARCSFADEDWALREALAELRLAERLGQVTETEHADKFAELALLLASAASSVGDMLGALGILREALELRPRDAAQARLWLRLADVQAKGGSRAEATASAERARSITTRGNNSFFDAELAILLAELTWADHGIVEAIQRFVDALGTPQPDPLAERWHLATRLGHVYENAGDKNSAIAYHQLAVTAATRAGDDLGRALAYAALMRVYGQAKEYELARRTGESAVEILCSVGDRRRTRETLVELRQIMAFSERSAELQQQVDRRAQVLAATLGFVWAPEGAGPAGRSELRHKLRAPEVGRVAPPGVHSVAQGIAQGK